MGGPSFSAKRIIVVELTVAQSAYFLVQVEGVPSYLSAKVRSVAVCDT